MPLDKYDVNIHKSHHLYYLMFSALSHGIDNGGDATKGNVFTAGDYVWPFPKINPSAVAVNAVN